MLIALLVFIPLITLEVRAEEVSYVRVPHPSLLSPNLCIIASYTDLPVPVAASRCSLKCGATVNCNVFCITAGKCVLSSSFVSASWQGTSIPDKFYTACYTRYPYRGNLLTPDLATNGSTPSVSHDILRIAPYAVNGYLCKSLDVSCFASNATDKSQFWMADMNTPKNIRLILYQGCGSSSVNGKQIRAGLNPDIFSDPVVATVTYVADYHLHSFEFDPPKLARYIGFTGPDYSALEVCKMMAFE